MSFRRRGRLHQRLREIRARDGVDVDVDVDGAARGAGAVNAFSAKGLRSRLARIRRRGREPVGASVALSIVIDEIIDTDNPTPDLFAPGFDAGQNFPERERLLILDLETTGLSGQSQIFMSGYLYWESGAKEGSASGREHGTLRLVQEVAADPAEERLLLQSAIEHISRRPKVVTYNGRSFDIPHLKKRLAFHSLAPLTDELEVVDLLHPARRRFKKELPNCKLGTIEKRIIGKSRDSQDVCGAEAPLRFLDYARHRERRHIDPVLYHNRIDLTTLAVLYVRLLGGVVVGVVDEMDGCS